MNMQEALDRASAKARRHASQCDVNDAVRAAIRRGIPAAQIIEDHGVTMRTVRRFGGAL